MFQSNKEIVKRELDDINTTRFLRIKDVMKITGISKSYIYQLVSNNQFPKSIKLVPGGSSCAWIEKEIYDWADSRIKDRDSKVA
jgi:prophage regulatory protein